MKTLRNFFITLLISLSTVFAVYPEIAFAENTKTAVSTGGNTFPIIFVIIIISSMVLACLVYIIGEIVNRK